MEAIKVSNEIKDDQGTNHLIDLGRIKDLEDRNDAHIKQNRTLLWIVITFIVCAFVSFFYYADHQENSRNKEQAIMLREFTEVNHEWRKIDLGRDANKEFHRKFGYRIFAVHGFAYDEKKPIAFSHKQKVRTLELAFNIAEDLQKLGRPISEWDFLATGVGETSLNPNALGGYGEHGYLQFKWATAAIAYGYYNMMPEWFRAKYPIELNAKEDLFDPIISTVLFYVYYGQLLMDYHGSQMWAISEYHWGAGFLSAHRYQRGHDIPVSVTIQGVEYSLIDYYYNWVGLRDAFENGELEVGKGYARELVRMQKKLLKEEVRLNTAKDTIKGLRNSVRDLKEDMGEMHTKLSNYYYKEQKAMAKFSKIYKDIQDQKFDNIREKMEEDYPIIMEWVKDYVERNPRDAMRLYRNRYKIGAAGIVALVCITLIVGISAYFIGRRKAIKKLNKKRKGTNAVPPIKYNKYESTNESPLQRSE